MILAHKVSTSANNGKSFYPHREATMCQSCGEKVVICPHRSFEKELILTLPLYTTHIMISRPYCREPPKYIYFPYKELHTTDYYRSTILQENIIPPVRSDDNETKLLSLVCWLFYLMHCCYIISIVTARILKCLATLQKRVP